MMKWPSALFRRPSELRGDRGAVAAIVAILSLVLLMSAAFTVDLGKQHVVRSDMQALADVVAIDLARDIDGIKTSKQLHDEWLGLDDSGEDEAKVSVERNQGVMGDAQPSSHASADGWTCTDHACVMPQAGVYDSTTGTFTVVGVDDTATKPNAVQVSAAGSVGFTLNPVGPRRGSATRSSIAVMGVLPTPSGSPTPSIVPTPTPTPTSTTTPLPTTPSACFEIGSYLLGVQSGDSTVLNAVVGDALGVRGIGYGGIATADVSLLGIATDVGVGTVDGLISDPSLTVGKLVAAEISVLQSQSPQNTVAISALQSLNAQLAPAVKARAVVLSNVIAIGSPGVVADATINALDLLFGSVQAMNGDSFLDTGLDLDTGKLAGVKAQLKLIQKPQVACNNGTATTSQVVLELSGSILGGVAGTFTVDLSLARAHATLKTLSCSSGGPSAEVLNVGNDGVASAEVKLSLLLGLVTADVKTKQSDSTTGSPFSVGLPTYYAPNWYQTAHTATPLGALTSSDLNVLGLISLPLGAVLDVVNTALIGPLNNLIATVIEPALGLNLSGVDLAGIKTPVCPAPALALAP